MTDPLIVPLTRFTGKPKLSILIPIHAGDQEKYRRLADLLTAQVTDDIEILTLPNAGGKSIGEFRNELIDSANGEYCAFIDADDVVSPHYIQSILKAIEGRPDTVGFWVRRYINGNYVGRAKHSNEFSTFSDRQRSGHTEFDRTPNHLNPTRTEIVRQIRFPEIEAGEDKDYSLRLKASGLIKTQVFIDADMYDYLKIP